MRFEQHVLTKSFLNSGLGERTTLWISPSPTFWRFTMRARPSRRLYTLPAAWYVDERIARIEHEQVFGNNWIAVGRTDQVAAPGQFFTFDLDAEPLIVVRGADDELRAFYNVCRHHAPP